MARLFNKVNGNSCVLLVWGIIEKGLHLGKVPKGVVPGASVSGLGGYFLVWFPCVVIEFSRKFLHILKSVHAYWL